MKMTFTGVTSSEVSDLISNVAVAFENKLKPIFVNTTYGGGVDNFVVVIVSVSSNISENEKFCKSHNRVGTDSHPVTGEKIRYVSVALPFDPELIESRTGDQVREDVCVALKNRLNNIGLKRIPKEFDFLKFSEDLQASLDSVGKQTGVALTPNYCSSRLGGSVKFVFPSGTLPGSVHRQGASYGRNSCMPV